MPDLSAPRAIFINYRRDDAGGEAGRLFDDLTREFGPEKVFMDVSGIQPGLDFRKAIDSNVAGCGVLLAIIGPQWSSIANHAGLRRLDDPNDFVRLEIAAALTRNIPVIPVFVHGASMPPPEALPEPLKDLAFRNGVELSLPRWRSDVALLLPTLKRYVSSDHQPIIKRLWPKIVAAALALFLLAYFLFRPKPQPPVITQVAGNELIEKAVKPNPIVGTPPPQQPGSKSPASIAATAQPAKQAPATSAEAKPHTESPPAVVAKPPSTKVESRTPLVPARLTPYQVPLPYNLNAIYADGAKFDKKGGMDGVGDAYHPFLPSPDTASGTLSLHGIPFHLGPVNDLDAVHSAHNRPVSIDLPAKPYSALLVLGAAVHHTQTSQNLVVTYGGPSSSSQTTNQSFSDWSAADKTRFPNEELAVAHSYRNQHDGKPEPGPFALYVYRIPLDSTKPLASLTLPKNDTVIVLAITLLP